MRVNEEAREWLWFLSKGSVIFKLFSILSDNIHADEASSSTDTES